MRWRVVWTRTHLYLGVVLGPAFVVLGVTGSIIAFRPELDEWLNADLMRIEEPLPPNQRASLDDLVLTARRAMPSDGRPYALVFPRTSRGVFYVTYSMPSPTLANARHVEWHQVFLHPGTGAVMGQRLMLDLGRPWRGPFVNVAQSIHRTLSLGVVSAPVLGVIAILLLISLVSGLVLWWPPAGRRLSSLRVRTDLGVGRAALDLHNFVGVVSAAVLAVALVSGIYLVEPRWIVGPLNLVVLTTELPATLTSGDGGEPIGFERAAAVATAHFSDGRMWMIQYPQGASGTYRVFRPSPEDRTDMLPSRQLWLDQYTGAVLAEFGPHTYTKGDHVEQLLYPLHSGEVAGLPGRVLVSVAGWTPLALFVTGVIRWWQKRPVRRFQPSAPVMASDVVDERPRHSALTDSGLARGAGRRAPTQSFHRRP